MQNAPRCTEHQTQHERRQRQYGSKVTKDTDRARRKATVDTHRREHGNWCPGWNRPAHQATDLTADHITEVALGGNPYGPLQVLCRSCNSTKNATAQHHPGG